MKKICRVDQLDMIYVGIYDITQYLGVPGDVWHQKVITLLTDIAKLAKSHGLAVGSVAPDKDYVKLLLESGYNFISYLPDSSVLFNYYEELTKAFRIEVGSI